MPATQKGMRMGLVGAGNISRNHLIAWAKLESAPESAKVVAICDPDTERARARGDEFGISKIYETLSEMLDAEALDAVDIATPRDTHAQLVLECAARGLPVLCQKPLAPTYEEARTLINAVGGRIRLMVHENWRFRPFYRRIAELVRSGALGRITQCSISVHRSGLIRDAQGQFPGLVRAPLMRTERRLIVAESLIHQLDVARWLIGRLVLKGAVASHVSPEVVGEDSAALLLESPSATSVVVMGSMTAAGTDPRAGDRFVLTGSRASLIYEKGCLSMRGDTFLDEHFDEDAAYQASFDGAIAHFVNRVASGEPFETEAEDNLHVLRLVEDAYLALGRVPDIADRGNHDERAEP